MYTPIVLPTDLTSNIYPEILNEITRDDGGTLATEAIDVAIQEIKMYLTRYDLVQLFGDQGTNVSATFTDSYLKKLVKDVALWYLLRLANPNVSYESAKAAYEMAIDSLKRIQKRIADPKWPYLDTTDESAPPGDAIYINANPERNPYF